MTDQTRYPGDSGFTLIEVLVAMVILAVGLLTLQALGVGAARSIALAQKQSEYAVLASSHLEDATELVRSGGRDACLSVGHAPQAVGPSGDLLGREAVLSSGETLCTVTVTLSPNPDAGGALRPGPLTVRSHVFLP